MGYGTAQRSSLEHQTHASGCSLRPQARRSGGPTCTSCQRPCSSLITHLIDTNTPPLCRTPACCAAGLSALLAAPRQLGFAACAMSAPCLRPCTLPACYLLPAVCLRPACCLRLSLARPGGITPAAHASLATKVPVDPGPIVDGVQRRLQQRRGCGDLGGPPRSLWRLISAWWPPWRCSSPWPWHQVGA